MTVYVLMAVVKKRLGIRRTAVSYYAKRSDVAEKTVLDMARSRFAHRLLSR